MFERFTDRARRVVVEAQEEARLLKHSYVGPEHILLGLLREGQGIAAMALANLGITLDPVRERVSEILGDSALPQSPSGHIPFTPQAKKVLELSLREAIKLGDNYIGTEHIMLGLVAVGDGVAVRALTELGADGEQIRQQVISTKDLHIRRRGESTSIPMPVGGPAGRGARGYIAALGARLDAVEDRLSAVSSELDRLRELLIRHGIDADTRDEMPDSDSDSGQG